jgi:hypothetical protein
MDIRMRMLFAADAGVVLVIVGLSLLLIAALM